jgi:hypothetical protein
VILSTAAILWGLHMRDATIILRLPALYLSTFLIIEAYQEDVELGAWSFLATSLACLIAAMLTHVFFAAQPEETGDDSTDQRRDSSGLVDLTILWAFIIAWLDGLHGTTAGVLAFALSIFGLPFLQWRGYPFLLAFTPAVVSASVLLFLTDMDVGDTMYRQTISALAGSIYGFFLCLMSIVGVSPAGEAGLIAIFADDDFVLVSDSDTHAAWFMRRSVSSEGYHHFVSPKPLGDD